MSIKPIFIYPVKACSIRLPKKNLKDLGGHRLFTYGLKAILEASHRYKGSYVIVSTESEEVILDVLRKYKFYKDTNISLDRRPEYLAKDPYQIGDVCKYILDKWGIDDLYHPLVMVQPTSPFITCKDIINCITMYEKFGTKANSIRTFKKVDKIWEDNIGAICVFTKSNMYYQSLGSIVVCKQDYVKKYGKFPLVSIPYVIPKERAVDIDDEIDFIYAEAIMKKVRS